MLRDEQIELAKAIIAVLGEHGPLLNEALRVGEDGSMNFEPISTLEVDRLQDTFALTRVVAGSRSGRMF